MPYFNPPRRKPLVAGYERCPAGNREITEWDLLPDASGDDWKTLPILIDGKLVKQ